jgi:hypothetical protein
MLVPIYPTTRRHTSEDGNLDKHCRENLTSLITLYKIGKYILLPLHLFLLHPLLPTLSFKTPNSYTVIKIMFSYSLQFGL